jgi:hypothetical protein
MRPDILPAVQHAHDQDAIGLLLVKNHMAAMHKAAETRGLQILTRDACERIVGKDSKTLLQRVDIAQGLCPTPTCAACSGKSPSDPRRRGGSCGRWASATGSGVSGGGVVRGRVPLGFGDEFVYRTVT